MNQLGFKKKNLVINKITNVLVLILVFSLLIFFNNSYANNITILISKPYIKLNEENSINEKSYQSNSITLNLSINEMVHHKINLKYIDFDTNYQGRSIDLTKEISFKRQNNQIINFEYLYQNSFLESQSLYFGVSSLFYNRKNYYSDNIISYQEKYLIHNIKLMYDQSLNLPYDAKINLNLSIIYPLYSKVDIRDLGLKFNLEKKLNYSYMIRFKKKLKNNVYFFIDSEFFKYRFESEDSKYSFILDKILKIPYTELSVKAINIGLGIYF